MTSHIDNRANSFSHIAGPIDLEGGLAFYPGEEPNSLSIGRMMERVHALSKQITATDAMEQPMKVLGMAQERADLTRHLPDVF
ncbi:hypothetical protein FJZ27_03445 [Candidatus Peribacteria bacterium]|nr:hypothetical protein [Candidatus Peribacteria bacterium]